jgi:hypothetical protein
VTKNQRLILAAIVFTVVVVVWDTERRRRRHDAQFYIGHAAGQIDGVRLYDQTYRRAAARACRA